MSRSQADTACALEQARRPRILVTRAKEQGSSLLSELRSAGIEPIHVPTIAIVDPATFAPLDRALLSLANFDWLVFTSSNAVERTLARAKVISVDVPAAARSSPPRIGCIGAATEAALRAHQLTAALIPSRATSEDLAGALMDRIGEIDSGGAHILLPRAEQARDTLPAALEAEGALVTCVDAYRNALPPGAAAQLRDALQDGALWPEGIAFTSSSTVTNLLTLLETAGLTLPDAVQRFSIGPITSQTLSDHGIPAHAQAAVASVASLVAAIRSRLGL